MKKSLIGLALSSLLLLSACEDEALTEKLLQAERTIIQLKVELAKQQKTQGFPVLQPKTLTLFDKKETIKFAANLNEKTNDAQAEIAASLRILDTGIEWLDQLQMQQTSKQITQNAVEGKRVTQEMLRQQMEQQCQKMGNEVIAEQLFNGESFELDTTLVGQRENVVTLRQTRDTYLGGVHGMRESFYLNFDVEKQRLITLETLAPKQAQGELTDTLWRIYKDDFANGWAIEKADFNISPEFYFNQNGVNFVYPPYILGSYAEGEITLTLSWYEAKKLINPDYLWFKSP